MKRRMQSPRKAKTGSRRSQSRLEARVKERTAELRAANRKLEREIQRRKGLEGEILEISDREQQRIGQELHDELCQHLTAVAFMTRAVALRLKNHRVIEFDDLDKISELVNQGATNARNIARGLHTAEVDAARLLPAIRDLVSREIWKTPCRLAVKTKLDLHDDAVASHLYRLLREAVINAHKHAQAKEIVVGISRSNGELVFSVTDDGVGIPAGKNNPHGMGFHIMNYRARTIGARLEVKRRQGRGTRVALYLPQSK